MKRISKFHLSTILIQILQHSIPKVRNSRFPFYFLRYSIPYVRDSVFLFIFLLPFSLSLPAQQQWTEPINISNLDGYTMHIDMVIDHDGVIHVVWDWRIESTHWLIMYTKSEDDGLTWSEPLNLLQNTDLWVLQPHIACDSKNNLYVTYTHDGLSWTAEGRLIKILNYDGHQWGEPIIVSEGMPGSHHNRIIIDYNDRIYVRWDYGPTGDDYIRYLENDTWSETFCPYPGGDEIYAMVEVDVDNSNCMHWLGASMGIRYPGQERLQYFFYDYSSNTWYPPVQPVLDTVSVGLDITLNINEIPETAYRRVSNLPPGVGFEGTMHTKKEGNTWLAPDLVSDTEKRQVGQQIAIDQNNDVQVVEIEYYNSPDPDGQLVHYHYSKKNWIGQPIDSALHMINYPKMIFSQNQLYVVYYKGDAVFSGDIWMLKYDIITNTKEAESEIPELKTYPNPSRDHVYIEFENNKQQHINLSIFDMTGKHIVTLINETRPPGMYRQLWKGTGNRKENAPGLYHVRLQSGRKTVSQAVEIIK